jgi:predicted nicotinamide N-methyase
MLEDAIREHVFVDKKDSDSPHDSGKTVIIDRPFFSGELDEYPATGSANSGGDCVPYWAALWPGARMLATAILRASWITGTEALEIGCGLGLPGIVGLAVGLRVTFSDIDPTALRFAASNARLNGFDHFKTLQLDWHSPPAGLRVPVLLASDVVYEIRNVEPLVNFIQKVLVPGGLCLIAEQDRLPSTALREALNDSGLTIMTDMARTREPGQKRVKGTLYRITQPDKPLDPPPKPP